MVQHRILSSLLAMLALSSFAGVGLAQEALRGPGAPASPGGVIGIIVKLEDDSVMSYRGTVAGLAATSPQLTGAARVDHRSSPVQAYRAYLAQKHAAFEVAATAAIPGAHVTYRYQTILGAVAMRVPASEVGRVAQLPGVKAVYPDQLLMLHTDSSPAFIRAKALWSKLGGQDDAGQGIVVGILDTGIWPEHPSFADPDPRGKPYPAPPVSVMSCDFGTPAFACNNKLIGAYRFMAAHDLCVANGNCVTLPGEFNSARDSNGHGTHTASTAAGNGFVDALEGRTKVSGVAPRAHVVAYKICGASGCYGSDSVAAIQQAVIDDVDVINFSIGGGASPYDDIVELAFKDAYAAGIFVAASAGNEGPGPNTVEHRGPWVTTVAASTQKRSFASTLTLIASTKRLRLAGVTITQGVKPAAPVVVNTDTFCATGAFPGKFSGKIVVCKRGGGVTRIQKGLNVFQGDAAGMILYNDQPDQGLITENHWLPSVHISNADGVDLLSFLTAHAGTTATFSDGKAAAAQGDVMAPFSSRGGTGRTLGLSKPDITAPGVLILAGTTPQPANPASGPPGELFMAIQGTSMSSPHVAGAGALLKHLHPDWTPGQIKSAIMTSASTKKLFNEDGVTPFTAFDAGSGRVDLKEALRPGLTFDVPASDYDTHENDLWNVNYPSIYLSDTAPSSLTVLRTAHSVLAEGSVWQLTLLPDPAGGLVVSLPSPTLTVPAGGTAAFTLGIDKSGIPANQSRHATLQLKYKSFLVHMPIGAAGPVSRPDLIVTTVATPAGGTRGSLMSVSAAVTNQGAATATSFTIQLYLSRDNSTLDAGDAPFSFCNITSLAVGDTAPCFGSYPIPVSIPAGEYVLIVRVDDWNTVEELSETNNIGTSASAFIIN